MILLVLYSVFLILPGLYLGNFLYSKSLFESTDSTLFLVQATSILSVLIGVLQLIVLKCKRGYFTGIIFTFYICLLYSSGYVLIFGTRTSTIAICEKFGTFCSSPECLEEGGEGDFSSILYVSSVFIALVMSAVGPRVLFRCRFSKRHKKAQVATTIVTKSSSDQWAVLVASKTDRLSMSYNSQISVSTPRVYNKPNFNADNADLVQESLSYASNIIAKEPEIKEEKPEEETENTNKLEPKSDKSNNQSDSNDSSSSSEEEDSEDESAEDDEESEEESEDEEEDKTNQSDN